MSKELDFYESHQRLFGGLGRDLTALSEFMQPGEKFITNAWDGVSEKPKWDTSKSAEEIKAELEATGRYESLRVIPCAFTINDRQEAIPYSGHHAVVGVSRVSQEVFFDIHRAAGTI